MNIRTKLVGVAALIGLTPVFAQVKVNDTVTVTGWAVGSYQNNSQQAGVTTDSLNMDAALLQATITPAKKTTAVVSMYYRPSAEGGVSPNGSEATLLDAYVSYDAGGGVTLTAGKFLSYLGYESFYQISDNMITLANQSLLAPIPGYHEGFKIDDAIDKTNTIGAAIVDSLYQKPGYNATEGTGGLRHSAGFEAYYQNTSITNLTVWIGGGYETKETPGFDTSGVTNPKGAPVYLGDVWASYTLNAAGDQLAAEMIEKDGGGSGNSGYDWLLYYQYNIRDTKVSTWFCFSGEEVTGGASYLKYSVSPTYTFNPNLSFRLQYSYTAYTSAQPLTRANFAGAEVLFKF